MFKWQWNNNKKKVENIWQKKVRSDEVVKKDGFLCPWEKGNQQEQSQAFDQHKEKAEHFVSYSKDKSHGYIWYVILEFSSIMKSNISKQGHCNYPGKY